MEVSVNWFGQTCFKIDGRDSISIVTDPYSSDIGIVLARLRADVVTVSHHTASCEHLAAVEGPFKLLDGPGEYEISGVFITAVSTFADNEQGTVRGRNTVFAFDFDGTTICHLGRLGHVPAQSQVKDLGSVSVLLVPVGGGGSLTSTQASEAIGLFEPDVVVPMRYQVPRLHEELDSVDHFLREMGRERVAAQGSLTVSRPSASSETEIVVLEPSP